MVGYEVYVRSFNDADGNGFGDLEGVRLRLEYLGWLGVDAVWITPFYPTPGYDAGYDVSDYTDVDPRHGTLEDFDRLVEEAHIRGLRVIVDMVPNHSSSHHYWFRQAVADPQGPYRNFYIWRDPGPGGGPPNNWVSHFGGPAWTLEPASGQYYCHLFLPEQPDLNWANPAVWREFDDILRFWCDRGVDGFRVDVAYGVCKDSSFRDNPQVRAVTAGMSPGEVFESFEHLYDLEQEESLEVFERWHRVVAPYGAILIGEVRTGSPKKMKGYVGDGGRFDFVFYLEPGWMGWEPAVLLERILEMHDSLPEAIGWVTDNHDQSRSVSRFGGGAVGERRSTALATLLMGLGGMPFIYQGQELGLPDGSVDVVDADDPITTRNAGAVGRDGARTVIPWEHGPGEGFTAAGQPWLVSQPREASQTVLSQRENGESPLHRYRDLLSVRKIQVDLTTAPAVHFHRTALQAGIRRGSAAIIANLGPDPASIALPHGEWSVVFSSSPGMGATMQGHVTAPPETTLLLATATEPTRTGSG